MSQLAFDLDLLDGDQPPVPLWRLVKCGACGGMGTSFLTGETCTGCQGQKAWSLPFLGGGCVGGCRTHKHWHRAHTEYAAQ